MKIFSENELAQIAFGYYDGVEIVDRIEGECDRWTQNITTIFKYENKLYALDWYRALTEYQEDEFYNQPYEVKRVRKMAETVDYVQI